MHYLVYTSNFSTSIMIEQFSTAESSVWVPIKSQLYDGLSSTTPCFDQIFMKCYLLHGENHERLRHIFRWKLRGQYRTQLPNMKYRRNTQDRKKNNIKGKYKFLLLYHWIKPFRMIVQQTISTKIHNQKKLMHARIEKNVIWTRVTERKMLHIKKLIKIIKNNKLHLKTVPNAAKDVIFYVYVFVS